MATNKIIVMYLDGSRFVKKHIDTGTTVGQFRADNNIPANAIVNVDTDDVMNDFVLLDNHNISVTVDNKNGGENASK
tara:strand:+ start:435 stop:665 length:231 start_codon:yes stop_codon:yes gene_type:complete